MNSTSAILSSAEEGKLRTEASSEVGERREREEREVQQAELSSDIPILSDMTDTPCIF